MTTMYSKGQNSDQVVRLSLIWVLVSVLAMLVLGAVGGMVASQLWPNQRMPLSNESEQIITTIQEVTISPNQAAADLVAIADRSVVSIAVKGLSDKSLLATGTVVTNDGLIVTSATLPKDNLIAIDWRGAEVPLAYAGRDELFGLSYLRIQEGLISPLDVRSDNVPVGNELLIVSRAKSTGLVRVDDYRVREWVLPPELGLSGIQRLLKGMPIDSAALSSGALIDEDKRLAGIVINQEAGLILGGDHLLMSIQRIATNKRELDPLGELGLKVHYSFLAGDEEGRSFVAEIVTVTEKSWAHEVGLKARDEIVKIDGKKLSWENDFVSQITNVAVKQMTVRRGSGEITLDLK